MFTRKSLLRPLVMGWTISFSLHSLLVALLVADAIALITLTFTAAKPSGPPKVVTIASGWAKLRPAEEPLDVRLAKNDNEVQPSNSAEPPPVKPVDVDPIPANTVAEMVKNATNDANERTDEENLEKLDSLANTLNQVSSSESLDGLTKSLNKAFGNKPRATAPAAEPVEGDFDFDTAQIHDVRREEADDGSFKYTAILLDAEGRTLDSELDEESGQRIYDVMVLIKKSPLLEKLYRQTLMSLFDQMMKEANTATVGAKKNAPPPPAEPEPPVKPNNPQPGQPFDPFAE